MKAIKTVATRSCDIRHDLVCLMERCAHTIVRLSGAMGALILELWA